ncbi:MAG: hypothetical protein VCA13_01605, partial [PS1 clade bacterium]
MATRAIPKMDVLECLPSATEIAQRRVVGKDLDFIQNMIERADALTIQAQNATDYIQLSKIIDNFQKLASRAEERSFTLKEFSKDSNPLIEINNSGQLQEKVRLLSEAIEPQITNLKLQFEANVNSQFEKYNAEIDNLSSSINSASSSGDVVALYEPIKNTINEIFENARVLNADANADTLIQRLNDVSQSYQEKADIYADAFKSDALSKINNIEQGISQLLGNVDSLNSVNSVNDHLSSLTEISRLVTSSASELNIYPESANIIININELSIATHDKITNM